MAYTFKHGDRPLDGHTIQRAVGRGGFGEVYYALTDSGKQVALKYLRDNAEVELRGIAHVMNLKSPHLITIYDVKKTDQGDPFVVMEYISGPSLRDLINNDPQGMSPEKAAYFLKGIAAGLSYLHDRGIVHRDLKPGNIFYDDGYVKIGDYGLSKHISVSKHSGQTVSVGTVHYMAPEIGSGSYTKAIDIYALGVILFEILTGRLPFSGSSMGEILMRHLSEQPDLTGVPEPFASVIGRALAKDPLQRFQDVNDMVDAVLSRVDPATSVSSFDPASLSAIQRQEDTGDPDRTVTRTPALPPIPALDARVTELGQLPQRLQKRADRLAARLEKRVARIERRAGKKAGAEARHAGRPAPPPIPMAGGAATSPVPAGSRASQAVVLATTSVAVAIVLGMVAGGRMPETPISIWFHLAGATGGLVLAHLAILRNTLAANWFTERMAYGIIAAICMVPGIAIADDARTVEKLAIPMLASIVLCDWSRRMDMGRMRHIEAGEAFWPAVIGFVAGGMTRTQPVVAAGACAALSLLTQTAAAMWPRSAAPRTTGVAGGGRPAAAGAAPSAPEIDRRGKATDGPFVVIEAGFRDEHDEPAAEAPRQPRNPVLRFASGILATVSLIAAVGCFFALVIAQPRSDEVFAPLMFFMFAGVAWLPFWLIKSFQEYRLPLWRGTMRWAVMSAGLTLAGGMITLMSVENLQDEELAGAIFGLSAAVVVSLVCGFFRGPGASRGSRRSAVQMPRANPQMDVAAPSFVGRTANAGLAFVGKLLLLFGVLLAVAYSVDRPVDLSGRGSGFVLADRKLTLLKNGERQDFAIHPLLVLAPIVVGGAGLAFSRRNDGGAHFARGLVGTICAMACAFFVVGPSAESVRLLVNDGEWDQFRDLGKAIPLIPMAAFGSLAVTLLLWPKTRYSRTVVV
ncbi:MAG: Serine/threonine-protein kinase PknD [Phycisphaerae bacterium]|nr:Serine/threonine-protein kinase PknD [Phycisphaerae bacterium]